MVGLLGLTSVLLVGLLSKREFVQALSAASRAGGGTAGRLMLLLLPAALSSAVPVAALVGTITALSSMASDREILAIRAAGIPYLRHCVPVVVAAGVLSLGLLGLNRQLVPRSALAGRVMVERVGLLSPASLFHERTRIEVFPNHLLYIKHIRGNRMRGVRIFALDEKGRMARKIIAERGTITGDAAGRRILLHLESGADTTLFPDSPERLRRVSFETYDLPLQLPAEVETGPTSDREMTSVQIAARIREDRQAGIAVDDLCAELHERDAMAFSALALVVLAIPLGARSAYGRAGALALSIAGVLGYYALMLAAERLAVTWASPGAAALLWVPNVVFLGVGLTLMWRQMRI